jgi:hypothetical protein
MESRRGEHRIPDGERESLLRTQAISHPDQERAFHHLHRFAAASAWAARFDAPRHKVAMDNSAR